MTSCVTRACCVLHRGEVFVRELGAQAFRAVGNSSQLRIDHVNDALPLLSATALDACCGLLGVTVQMRLACASDENFGLGFRSTTDAAAAQEVTQEFVLTEDLLVGHFLAFDSLADAATVVVTGLSDDAWVATAGGLKIVECAPAATVTVKYSRPATTTLAAGLECEKDVELLYVGTNMFDGSKVRLHIPQVRFLPVQSFDWINGSDTQDLAFEGRVVFAQNTWYDVQRVTVEKC